MTIQDTCKLCRTTGLAARPSCTPWETQCKLNPLSGPQAKGLIDKEKEGDTGRKVSTRYQMMPREV